MVFDNVVVVLPKLGMEDAIHAFVYSLKPHLKGVVKVEESTLMHPKLNKAMRLALKLEENATYAILSSS